MEPLALETLWSTARIRLDAALHSGHLEPIEAELTTIEEDGWKFAVRIARNVERKRQHVVTRDPAFNPFANPEPALALGTIPPAHLALLNKFPVVSRHVLLVTRTFVPQGALLDEGDFEALHWTLRAAPALVFYNGGTEAGASQKHRHLQLVPLPLLQHPKDTFFEQALATERFPFAHAIAPLGASASESHSTYLRLLALIHREQDGAAYNLLATREKLLLVPRTKEHAEGISLNALAFAGSLFVRDQTALERVQKVGPLALLRAVTE